MYGCEHYLRRSQLKCSQCDKVFTCIHCHNAQINDHQMVPTDVKDIVCTACGTVQEVAQNCSACGICFGNYFCKICMIFDDTLKYIVHCDKCKLCRVSLGQKLIHCEKCNICCFDEHKTCFAIGDCPICCDDLHSSTHSITVTKCGHWVHQECLQELLKRDYKCPTCQKSLMPIEMLESIMDQEVAINIMPEEYANKKQMIFCIDCEKKSEVQFHFVGMKCPHCKSYNTRAD